MATIKISDLAKEMGLPTEVVLSVLKNLGHSEVKAHNSTIDDSVKYRIRDKMNEGKEKAKQNFAFDVNRRSDRRTGTIPVQGQGGAKPHGQPYGQHGQHGQPRENRPHSDEKRFSRPPRDRRDRRPGTGRPGTGGDYRSGGGQSGTRPGSAGRSSQGTGQSTLGGYTRAQNTSNPRPYAPRGGSD